MSSNYVRNFTAKTAVGKYLAVMGNGTDGQVVLANSSTGNLIGVTTDASANTDERLDVVLEGPTLAIAGAAFAVGDLLTCDANGKLVKAIPAVGGSVSVVAWAIQGASALNDVVEVYVSLSRIKG